MGQHVAEFYGGRTFDLQLDLMLAKVVLPFGGGMILSLAAGAVLSLVLGAVRGDRAPAGPRLTQRSRFDQIMWVFMRLSGVLILPLVFGHLAIMHVIEGVFAINQGGQIGEAANFVAARWAYIGWRLYDAGLLALALVHGFNGFRYVVNDYAGNRVVRRGLNWALLVGCLVLIYIGAMALLQGVPAAP
jgi:succinate dehydrogenase / fumarate reductase membrane anchor subunit